MLRQPQVPVSGRGGGVGASGPAVLGNEVVGLSLPGGELRDWKTEEKGNVP